jgi:DNA-binding transcriptional LysR family regulator
MRFDNAEAIKAMLASGFGMSMLPYWTVSKEVQEGRLFILQQQEQPLVSNIALVSRKSSHESQPVSAFIQFAKTFENRRLRLTGRTVSR